MKFLKCANVTDSVARRNVLPHIFVYFKKAKKNPIKSNE